MARICSICSWISAAIRVCYEITISFLLAWEDGVIPLSVEGVPLEMELLQGLLRDFDPSWIRVLIQLAYNCQPRRGRRGRNEVHHHFVAHEGLPAPVLTDEGEQPMLALVPLTRPRREVGYGDLHPCLIRVVYQAAADNCLAPKAR